MSLTAITNSTTEIAQLTVNITVFFTDSTAKFGSGILIDGKTIVTAAHVVDDYDYPVGGPVHKTIDHIEVVPALNDSTTPYGTY